MAFTAERPPVQDSSPKDSSSEGCFSFRLTSLTNQCEFLLPYTHFESAESVIYDVGPIILTNVKFSAKVMMHSKGAKPVLQSTSRLFITSIRFTAIRDGTVC